MSEIMAGLSTFDFAQPWWLVLLPGVWWLGRRAVHSSPLPAIRYSSFRLLAGVAKPVPAKPERRIDWWVAIILTLLVMALARPRVEKAPGETSAQGIDIMLVLDISRSMDAQDFDLNGQKVTRFAALREVVGDFVASRPNDRIGIIGFAEKPFIISPLTLDHRWLLEALAETRTSLGSAIGSGVEAAVDLLRHSAKGPPVIIVVTDGLNTSGLDPLESARLARRSGSRLYTIATVSYAEMRSGGVDGLMLQQMARMTGGQFFQAANTAGLEAVYRQIDELERTEARQRQVRSHRELFPWFAWPAFGLLAAELVYRGYGRRRAP